ncbi:MAG TPA: hypothetical protein VJ799_00085 [Nitrososphaeraceae archaeon]|nr:hypothetical protein [Nitrososphaeraceae archaeon]
MNSHKAEGDWRIISLDENILRVKLVHKNRGKFKIVDDTKGSKYVDRIVDAGDILQVEK